MMTAIAFLVFFSNAMLPALLPELAREFHVGPFDLKWLVPGFTLAYAGATLVYGMCPIDTGAPQFLSASYALPP
jgi:hypothetical protein